MNLLDFLILIPIVWGFIRGLTKGLIIELATLAGLILGILAAYYFATEVSELIRSYFTFSDRTARTIAYILIFVAVMIIAYIIGKIIEKTVDLIALGWLNKLLGAIVGLAKGALVAGLIIYLIVTFDRYEKIITRQVKEKSMFFQAAARVIPSLVPGIQDEQPEEVI
jgi:membrane protein required for colicin V production